MEDRETTTEEAAGRVERDRDPGEPEERPSLAEEIGEREAESVPTYSREDLPSQPETWPTHRKVAGTRALRIDGPFRVETSESENEPFYCEDGYLAVDARGYPYAIAAEEFDLIYKPSEEVVAALLAALEDQGQRVTIILGSPDADQAQGGLDEIAKAAQTVGFTVLGTRVPSTG